MGGELSRDKKILSGYDEIYGPKTYYLNDKKSKEAAGDVYNSMDSKITSAYGSKEPQYLGLVGDLKISID